MNFFHIFHAFSVRKIMLFVLLACIPGIITKCYFFGIGTAIQIFFAIVVSFILEICILKMRLKNIKINAFDNSSIVTATLLGFSVPSLLPWWMMTIALFFSIVISKHLYGGIGQNIFNPAMVGYVILLLSFPLNMSDWNKKNYSISLINDFKNSFNIIFLNKNIDRSQYLTLHVIPDAYTEATPLDFFKTQSHINYHYNIEDAAFKNKDIRITTSWKYINLSFLISGLFLLVKKIICWRIPLSFLTTLGFCSSLSFWYSKNLFASPLVHFLSGGTMICAFFIATDPVTTACTNKGKIIFGIIIGFLVWILRNYSDYPDGIAFSVLFANMTVPLIDNYIKKDGYGHGKI